MILSISNLDFSYGKKQVISKVAFDLHGGELLAILGPNGAGKTSLLKCINAIHRPKAGTILVEDRNILSMPPHQIALNIGYVAQQNEPARLTVFDAILMGRKPHFTWKVSDKDLKIVDSALKRLSLVDISLRYMDQLSGGELQKVAIARALVQEPKLLLLDEPTSFLDLKNQIDILTLLRRVVDEHKIGAVMSMHDLNTALRYADKILFLKNGQVHSMGPAGEVQPSTVEDVYGVPVEIHFANGFPVVIPI